MLFRKSLRLSAAARARYGSGGIANLQANDCTNLYSIVSYLHVLWSGPFQASPHPGPASPPNVPVHQHGTHVAPSPPARPPCTLC